MRALPVRSLCTVALNQVQAMDSTESAGYARATIQQLALDASKTELICIDCAAVWMHGLAICGSCVGNLLQMHRLLAVVAGPLSQTMRNW